MDSTLRKILITIYVWSWIAIGCVVATIVIIPGWLVGKGNRWCRSQIENRIAVLVCNVMQLSGIWTVEFIDNRSVGDNRVDKNLSCVIVSNHVSLIDTVFTAQLPYDKVYTWAAKWKHTPVFGWLCQLAGHISIDKTCPVSKRSALDLSRIYLENDSSIVFYAEGRRGRNPHTTLPFKTGAFRVAQSSGKNVLPVTLIGTHEACNGFLCDFGSIKVIMDDPVKVGDINHSVEEVRSIIQTNLDNHYQVKN